MGQGFFDGIIRECFHAGDTGGCVGWTRWKRNRSKAKVTEKARIWAWRGGEGDMCGSLRAESARRGFGEEYQISGGCMGPASSLRVKFWLSPMAQENHSRMLDKGIRILFFNYKDASSVCMENGVYGEKVRTHRSRIVRMLLKLVTITVTKTGVLETGCQVQGLLWRLTWKRS